MQNTAYDTVYLRGTYRTRRDLDRKAMGRIAYGNGLDMMDRLALAYVYIITTDTQPAEIPDLSEFANQWGKQNQSLNPPLNRMLRNKYIRYENGRLSIVKLPERRAVRTRYTIQRGVPQDIAERAIIDDLTWRPHRFFSLWLYSCADDDGRIEISTHEIHRLFGFNSTTTWIAVDALVDYGFVEIIEKRNLRWALRVNLDEFYRFP